MTRNQFRRRFSSTSMSFVHTNLPSLKSETDPTFALTGMQMFLAAMRGEALPSPPIVQEYSGVHADDLTPVDNPMSDRFQTIEWVKKHLHDVDDKVLTLKKQIDNENN